MIIFFRFAQSRRLKDEQREGKEEQTLHSLRPEGHGEEKSLVTECHHRSHFTGFLATAVFTNALLPSAKKYMLTTAQSHEEGKGKVGVVEIEEVEAAKETCAECLATANPHPPPPPSTLSLLPQ